MNKLALTAAGILAAIAVAAPASAVTRIVTTGAGTFAAPDNAGATQVNFNFNNFNQFANNGFSISGSVDPYDIVVASSTGQFAQPNANQSENRYLAVRANGQFQALSTTAYNTVSFFLGSVDGYNSVTLLGAGGTEIASFNGSQLIAPNTPNGTTGYRVTFTTQPGDAAFYGIRINSSQNAAELDNLVFAVPEPSTWALMLAGFGMVGFAMRSRRRVTTVFA